MGPALSPTPVLSKIDPPITRHIGATPELLGSADITPEEAERLLGLAAMKEITTKRTDKTIPIRGTQALDALLLDPTAGDAVRIVQSLARISPNATTSDELAAHLGADTQAIHDALDTLSAIGVIDTGHREPARVARLSARLRQKHTGIDIIGLA